MTGHAQGAQRICAHNQGPFRALAAHVRTCAYWLETSGWRARLVRHAVGRRAGRHAPVTINCHHGNCVVRALTVLMPIMHFTSPARQAACLQAAAASGRQRGPCRRHARPPTGPDR